LMEGGGKKFVAGIIWKQCSGIIQKKGSTKKGKNRSGHGLERETLAEGGGKGLDEGTRILTNPGIEKFRRSGPKRKEQGGVQLEGEWPSTNLDRGEKGQGHSGP